MKFLYLFFLSLIVAEANVNVVCKAGIMDNVSAKKYINKLLVKEPENIECMLKLADIHLKSGSLLKGYKFITRAYNINPYDVEHSSIAGILPYAMKMTKLEKRAKKNSDITLWNKLGDNFFSMGVYGESTYAYERSLELNENQTNIGLKLALSYKKSNQIYKAVDQLKFLLNQDSENFYANYYLGKILRYSVKDEENAKKYLIDAKEILLSSEENFPSTEYPRFMHDITLELGK